MRAWVGGTSQLLFYCPVEQGSLTRKQVTVSVTNVNSSSGTNGHEAVPTPPSLLSPAPPLTTQSSSIGRESLVSPNLIIGTALRSFSPAFRAAATRSPSNTFIGTPQHVPSQLESSEPGLQKQVERRDEAIQSQASSSCCSPSFLSSSSLSSSSASNTPSLHVSAPGGEEEDEEMEVGLHFLAPAVVADSLLLTSEEEVVAELEELEDNSWGGVQDEADEQTINSGGSRDSSWGGMEGELSSLIEDNNSVDVVLATSADNLGDLGVEDDDTEERREEEEAEVGRGGEEEGEEEYEENKVNHLIGSVLVADFERDAEAMVPSTRWSLVTAALSVSSISPNTAERRQVSQWPPPAMASSAASVTLPPELPSPVTFSIVSQLPDQQPKHSASDIAIRPDPIRLPVIVGEAFPLVDVEEGVKEIKKEEERIDEVVSTKSIDIGNIMPAASLPFSGSSIAIQREKEGINEDEDEDEGENEGENEGDLEDDDRSEVLERGEEAATLESHSFEDAHEVGSYEGSYNWRDVRMSSFESLHGFETAEEGDLTTLVSSSTANIMLTTTSNGTTPISAVTSSAMPFSAEAGDQPSIFEWGWSQVAPLLITLGAGRELHSQPSSASSSASSLPFSSGSSSSSFSSPSSTASSVSSVSGSSSIASRSSLSFLSSSSSSSSFVSSHSNAESKEATTNPLNTALEKKRKDEKEEEEEKEKMRNAGSAGQAIEKEVGGKVMTSWKQGGDAIKGEFLSLFGRLPPMETLDSASAANDEILADVKAPAQTVMVAPFISTPSHCVTAVAPSIQTILVSSSVFKEDEHDRADYTQDLVVHGCVGGGEEEEEKSNENDDDQSLPSHALQQNITIDAEIIVPATQSSSIAPTTSTFSAISLSPNTSVFAPPAARSSFSGGCLQGALSDEQHVVATTSWFVPPLALTSPSESLHTLISPLESPTVSPSSSSMTPVSTVDGTPEYRRSAIVESILEEGKEEEESENKLKKEEEDDVWSLFPIAKYVGNTRSITNSAALNTPHDSHPAPLAVTTLALSRTTHPTLAAIDMLMPSRHISPLDTVEEDENTDAAAFNSWDLSLPTPSVPSTVPTNPRNQETKKEENFPPYLSPSSYSGSSVLLASCVKEEELASVTLHGTVQIGNVVLLPDPSVASIYNGGSRSQSGSGSSSNSSNSVDSSASRSSSSSSSICRSRTSSSTSTSSSIRSSSSDNDGSRGNNSRRFMADARKGNVPSCQTVMAGGGNASQASSSPALAEESRIAEGSVLDEIPPITPILASVKEQEEEEKDEEEQEHWEEEDEEEQKQHEEEDAEKKDAEDDDGKESAEEDGTLSQEKSPSQNTQDYICEGDGGSDEDDEDNEVGRIVAVQDRATHGHAPLSGYGVALEDEAVVMAAKRTAAALRLQSKWRMILERRVTSQARELILQRKENETRSAAAATVTAQFLVNIRSASLPVQYERVIQMAEESAFAAAEVQVQVCAQAHAAGNISATAADATKALPLATSERQARAVKLLNSYSERIQGRFMLQRTFTKLQYAIMEKVTDKLEHATSKIHSRLAFKYLHTLQQNYAATSVAATLVAEAELHTDHCQASAAKVHTAFRRWMAVRDYPSQEGAHRLIPKLVSAHSLGSKSIAFCTWRAQTLTVVHLQRLIRGHLARMHFQRSQVAILRIQVWYRKCQLRCHCSVEKQDLFSTQNALLKLQSMARDLLAAQEAQQRKEALADLSVRMQAVLTIQRMMRRCLGRMAAQSAPLVEESEATIPLQGSIRGRMAQVKPQYPRVQVENMEQEEVTTIVADAHLLQPTVSTLEQHGAPPVAKKRSLDVVGTVVDVSSVLSNPSQLTSSLSSSLRPGRLMAILRRKTMDKSVEEREQADGPEATTANAAGFTSPVSSRQVFNDEDTNQDWGGTDISQSVRASRKSSLLGLGGWLRPGRTESVEDGKMGDLNTRTRSRTTSTQATQGTVKEMERIGRTFDLFTRLSSDTYKKEKAHVQQSALLQPLEVEVQEEGDNRPVEQLLSPCPWLEDGGVEEYLPTLVTHHQEKPEMPALPVVGKMHAIGCNPFALLSLLHVSPSASNPSVTLMAATPESPIAAIKSIISDEGKLNLAQLDLAKAASSTIHQLQCDRDSPCKKLITSSSGERLSRAFQAIKLALDPFPPKPEGHAAARRASAPTISATAAVRKDRYSYDGQQPSFTSAGLGLGASGPERSSRTVSMGYSRKASSARPALRDTTSTLSCIPSHETPFKGPIPILPMVRTQAQFRTLATPKKSLALRKPKKTIRVSSHQNVCGNAHKRQEQLPRRTKHCVAKPAQRGAKYMNQGVEYLDYHSRSGEGNLRKLPGRYRSQKSVPGTSEVEVARFYRKQCERLVLSVEGLQPWLIDRDGKKEATAVGQVSILRFEDMPDQEGPLTKEERARRYRAASDMESLMVMVREDLKTPDSPAVAKTALKKQVHKLLASLEAFPESRRLVSSSFSVLRFYVAYEPDACNILTTAEAVRILFDAMQAHVDENEIIEDGLLILMGLTETAKNREMIRSALPVYGLNILATFQARIDRGSPGHRTLDSLKRRLSEGGIKGASS
ncbi:hypothetical protein VYU27_005182 [Nannochloropsis oceanica]